MQEKVRRFAEEIDAELNRWEGMWEDSDTEWVFGRILETVSKLYGLASFYGWLKKEEIAEQAIRLATLLIMLTNPERLEAEEQEKRRLQQIWGLEMERDKLKAQVNKLEAIVEATRKHIGTKEGV